MYIVGALTAAETMVQLEMMGKQRDMSAAAVTFGKVDRLYERLIPVLQAFVSSGETQSNNASPHP